MIFFLIKEINISKNMKKTLTFISSHFTPSAAVGFGKHVFGGCRNSIKHENGI